MMDESQEKTPYIGPSFFKKQDKDIFFGRDSEARDILSLIIAHRTFLIYAQSGAGKTSLINAGLIPLLEEEGFEVLPVARVKSLIPEGMKPEEITNIYVFNSLMHWQSDKEEPPGKKKMKEEAKKLAQISIVSFLKRRKHLLDKQNMPSPRIIIFDQFEELFSFYPERSEEREDFFLQVAEALEEDPLLRVLFVIREDYLASLDPYVDILPEQLRARFRLECLSREAAYLAIENPLEGTSRSFAKRAVSHLIQELLKARGESITGEVVETIGEYVEPVQLQIVCKNFWESLPSDVKVITLEHIRAFGNVSNALRIFYARSLKTTVKETGIEESKLRTWFGNRLITAGGTRGTVYRGAKMT